MRYHHSWRDYKRDNDRTLICVTAIGTYIAAVMAGTPFAINSARVIKDA